MMIGGIEGPSGDRVLASPAGYTRVTFESGDEILERAMLFRPWYTSAEQGHPPPVKRYFGAGIEQYLGNVVLDNFTTSTLGGFI